VRLISAGGFGSTDLEGPGSTSLGAQPLTFVVVKALPALKSYTMGGPGPLPWHQDVTGSRGVGLSWGPSVRQTDTDTCTVFRLASPPDKRVMNSAAYTHYSEPQPHSWSVLPQVGAVPPSNRSRAPTVVDSPRRCHPSRGMPRSALFAVNRLSFQDPKNTYPQIKTTCLCPSCCSRPSLSAEHELSCQRVVTNVL
jgi:hypothetical protein